VIAAQSKLRTTERQNRLPLAAELAKVDEMGHFVPTWVLVLMGDMADRAITRGRSN